MNRIAIAILSAMIAFGGVLTDASAQITTVQPHKSSKTTSTGKKKSSGTPTGNKKKTETKPNPPAKRDTSNSPSSSVPQPPADPRKAKYDAAYQDVYYSGDNKERKARGYAAMLELTREGYVPAFGLGAMEYKKMGDYQNFVYYGERSVKENNDLWLAWELALYYKGNKDFENAFRCYQKAAQAGWWKGCCWYELGCMYENGRGTVKDLDKALGAYKQALLFSSRSDVYNFDAQQAYNRLGGDCLYDPDKFGKVKLNKSEVEGLSEYNLVRKGQDYKDGSATNPRDPYKAYACFQYGAEKGFPSAMIELAIMHITTDFGIQDMNLAKAYLENAVAIYEQRVAAGDPEAMLKLGSLYKSGLYGIPRDEAKSRAYYLKGAQAGQMYCMRYYAEYLLKDGKSAEGFRYMLAAAEKGDGMAQYEVGKMYRDGVGVTPDITKARYWLEKASKNHYASASDAARDLRNLR